MLKYGNREFRNLQEQVEENMKAIEKLKNGQAVLDEFGIKVVGEVEDIEDLPTVAEYKESTPDWEYGDAFAVGTESPYTLYILTRANESHEADYWFDIGEFPAVGPQGPQGPQGPEGQQGQTGDTGPAGADAGFGTPTATATMTARGSTPIVDITATGPNTEKVFNFDFYLPVATPKVTINSASGTLTLAEYNILHNFEDSVIVFRNGAGIDIVPYTLNRWYESSDYIVFVGLYSYSPYKTGIYRCRVDRSNRSYLLYADEAIKINKWNISTAIDSSTNETAGKVLTADGSGGASWENVPAGMQVVTLSTSTGTLSTDNYNKIAGEDCIIIYQDSSGTNLELRKYDETSTTIQYASIHGDFLSPDTSTRLYKLAITKSSKYYELTSPHLPITNSNIKTGSLTSGKFLKSNGSGGSEWGDGPSQVQSDWNEASSSSPAYIKNKPTIPSVPVTDVTVNGTSVLDGTTAKVLVDTVDGVSDGTNWTSLTINGTTASIPSGGSGGLNSFATTYSSLGTALSDADYALAVVADALIVDYGSSSYLEYLRDLEDTTKVTFTRTYNGGVDTMTLTKSTKIITNSVIKITGSSLNSGIATAGEVLTADGSGGATWASAGGGGTTLNAYQFYRAAALNNTYRTRIYNTLYNAKGNVFGKVQIKCGDSTSGGLKAFEFSISDYYRIYTDSQYKLYFTKTLFLQPGSVPYLANVTISLTSSGVNSVVQSSVWNLTTGAASNDLNFDAGMNYVDIRYFNDEEITA